MTETTVNCKAINLLSLVLALTISVVKKKELSVTYQSLNVECVRCKFNRKSLADECGGRLSTNAICQILTITTSRGEQYTHSMIREFSSLYQHKNSQTVMLLEDNSS